MRPHILLALALFLPACGQDNAASKSGPNPPADSPDGDPPPPPATINLKTELARVLGDGMTWNAAIVKALKPGMSCDEVRAQFPAMEACGSESDYNFVFAPVKGDAIVSRLRFTFRPNEGLNDAEIHFNRGLDRAAAKSATKEAMETKWGVFSADGTDGDILTLVNGDFAVVQRSLYLDHWMIRNDIADE